MVSLKKIYALVLTGSVLFIASCSDDSAHPGYEYMPDMYRSPSYETHSMNPLFADSMTARQPVAGTVARANAIYTSYDRLPYPYPNTLEGYEAAAALKNPLEASADNLAEGKRLYMNYCMICHGETGMGDGPVTNFNGPRPPAYNSTQLKDLPEGKAFHSIHYGKNMMGSHASQLTPTQRWKIVHYVKTLQQGGSAATASADTTKQ